MLIDSLVPVYPFHERHQLRLAAASGALIDAALRPETGTDPWVRLFIRPVSGLIRRRLLTRIRDAGRVAMAASA